MYIESKYNLSSIVGMNVYVKQNISEGFSNAYKTYYDPQSRLFCIEINVAKKSRLILKYVNSDSLKVFPIESPLNFLTVIHPEWRAASGIQETKVSPYVTRETE